MKHGVNTFSLQLFVFEAKVAHGCLALQAQCPVLDVEQNLILYVIIERLFEDGDEVVDELARGDFCNEQIPTILYASVSEL